MRIQVVEITEKVVSWMDFKYNASKLALFVDGLNHSIRIDFEDKKTLKTTRVGIMSRAGKMNLKLKSRTNGLSLYISRKESK